MNSKKTTAILIALLLVVSIGSSILATVNAHNTATDQTTWTINSYAYMSVAPNPIGVGQSVTICMWVDVALPGATLGNDIRRHNYSLTITAPDGKTETHSWPVVYDSTGVQFYKYTPTQVGNYTFFFNYPQQTYTWSGTYQDDIFTASNRTKTLTVTEDQIPNPIDSYPLPTEYWTRPIEEQNTYWYSIASNWLSSPYIIGAGTAYIGGQQTDGSAPNSAHIMWTKPLQYGGVVGGNNTQIPGEGYYQGLSYNPRFGNPIIMHGTLFYQEPLGNSGTGGDYISVDLRTGKELWRINASATGTSLVPSFGYLYTFDGPNQHGVLPNGLLVATTTVNNQGTVWRTYDPRTGYLTSMNVTNVPSGINVAGPSGEYLKYILTNYGTTNNPSWYLAQWNSSKVFGTIPYETSSNPVGWYSGTENASLTSCYDWNVSVSLKGTGWNIGTAARGIVPLVTVDNMLLCVQGTFGGHVGDSGATVTTNPANITAISLDPSKRGQVLWTQSYSQAPGNNTRFLSAWDPANGVFVFSDKESFANYGYNLANGQYLWGPSYPPETPSVDWNFMIWYTPFCQYGNLYTCGFSGLLYCYNITTGQLSWTFGNGGTGNSTSSGLVTPYGHYPAFVESVADGKIYLVGNEHSPNTPLYKDSRLRCINATDGTEIWSTFGWGNMMSGACAPIADGFLTVYNPYDGQIYCYGKGPSSMSVDITNDVISSGSSVMIKGTVTDISAGTQQNEQAARFPHGVPVVSDAHQGDWMEYVYMQKPQPSSVTGVPVTISVIDVNNNFRQIGITTTTNGFFSFNWKPDIDGQYTVYVSFEGSDSYYPSSAVTAFAVDPVAPTPDAQSQILLPPTEMYFAASTAAIIIAIAVVGAVIILVLKKRP
ncbi:MAG: PQQ-binding-like beta-propeller repeat protein [Nitrososphaerota archaeon]|jgi:hypothetical protein|nr:PQQ-binding-like beta-propeller repeat protein [Nitrososphaerota archaeon]